METRPSPTSSDKNLETSLKILNETKISKNKIAKYISSITPPQSLAKTLHGAQMSMKFSLGQIISNSEMFQNTPEGFDLSGPIIALGVATAYILGTEEGRFKEDENTHPFVDNGWDVDKETLKNINTDVKAALSYLEAKGIQPENKLALYMATSYLKVKKDFDKLTPIEI